LPAFTVMVFTLTGLIGSAEPGFGCGASEAATGGVAWIARISGAAFVSPCETAFAAAGASLEAGQTAGLIEVMKCFNPILHPGGAVPSPAVVARVLVREGEEVTPGQILVVVRSAPR